MKYAKRTVSIILIAALAFGILSGCGGASADLALEPFAVAWGITQKEAAAKLACAYFTNEKSPGFIYVENIENDDALQAFGATPSLIIYEFNLKEKDSGGSRLGTVTYQFSESDYETLLADLDQRLGQRYFDDPMWGTTDADVFLFKNGVLCVQYSVSPLTDPKTMPEDEQARYVSLAASIYGSMERTASVNIENYSLLWRYSTAETDFVLTDNRK